jgi:aerobic-type carbon monoxide dehydrogenase small subunit (CoxS/CutS family)
MQEQVVVAAARQCGVCAAGNVCVMRTAADAESMALKDQIIIRRKAASAS